MNFQSLHERSAHPGRCGEHWKSLVRVKSKEKEIEKGEFYPNRLNAYVLRVRIFKPSSLKVFEILFLIFLEELVPKTV